MLSIHLFEDLRANLSLHTVNQHIGIVKREDLTEVTTHLFKVELCDSSEELVSVEVSNIFDKVDGW